jgi:hypothetical protein
MSRTIQKLLTSRFVVLGLSGVLFIEVALWGLVASKVLDFENKISFQAFTVIPLFLIAIIQLVYNGRLQKTDFLRDYAEEFFTNESLYSAFHQLVYTYTDSDFAAVKAAVAAKETSDPSLPNQAKPIFFQVPRSLGEDAPGSRLYHPRYFQGSPEERRLDMLIGYFDLLGYHYSRGFLPLQDIAGSLGHYLNILSKREIMREMRQVYRDAIRDPKYAERNGRIRPFEYFEKLMKAIEEYNNEIEKALNRELERNTN